MSRLKPDITRLTQAHQQVSMLTDIIAELKAQSPLTLAQQSELKEHRRRLNAWKKEFPTQFKRTRQQKEATMPTSDTSNYIVLKHLSQEYNIDPYTLRKWFREWGLKHQHGQRYKWENENDATLKRFKSLIEERLSKA